MAMVVAEESPARGETDDDAPAPAFAPGFLDHAASKGKNRPASKSKSKPRDPADGPDGAPPGDATQGKPKKQPKKKTKATSKKYVPEQVNEVPYRTLTFARSVPPPVPEDTIHVPIKISEFATRASAAMDELTSVLNDAEADELLKDRTEEDVNVDDCIIEPVDKAVTRAIHEMQMRMQREAEEKARVERERAEAGAEAAGGGGDASTGAARGTEKARQGEEKEGPRGARRPGLGRRRRRNHARP